MRIDASGNLLVGTSSQSSNGSHKVVIESASTVGTISSHLALIGDSAVIGQGPQILFSESGDGLAWAGGTIGFARTGTNSVGDLVFGTRQTTGDINTTTTEAMRITSSGNLDITGGGDILFPWNNTGTYSVGQKARSANLFSTTRSLFEIKGADAVGGAQAMAGGDIRLRGGIGASNLSLGVLAGSVLIQGGETTHGLSDGAGQILFYTGGTATERMRITSDGKVGIGYAGPPSALFQVGWNGVATNDAINIGTAYSSNSTKTGKITWRDGSNIVGQIDTSYDGNSVSMTIGSLYKAGYNSTDIMRIDPRHITMGSQPHAQAYLNGTQNISGGVWTQVNMNDTDSNIGSHYNTSTRRFTAPVAGKYLITYSINFTTASGSSGYLYSRIDVNGAVRKYTQGFRIAGASIDSDCQLGGSLTLYLAANDYVTLAGYSTSANAFNGSTGPHRTYCNFTLLG